MVPKAAAALTSPMPIPDGLIRSLVPSGAKPGPYGVAS
jgi:hypothetical protein